MHISASKLPPALLDLTLLRVSSLNLARSAGTVSGTTLRFINVRSMHQAALASPSSPPLYNYNPSHYEEVLENEGKLRIAQGNLTIRSRHIEIHPSTELEKRVRALEEVALSEESSSNPPSFTEVELTDLYQDLLALPIPEQNQEPTLESFVHVQAKEDLLVVDTIEQRLLGSTEVEGITSALHDATRETQMGPLSNTLETPAHPYQHALFRINDIVSRIESIRSSLSPSKDFLPISVLSLAEWESVIRVCLQARDGKAAEQALSLMKRSGIPLSEQAVTCALKTYAEDGHVGGVEHILATYLMGFPTESQRHLHIKAHIKAAPLDTIPTSALVVLHSYETQALPAPIKTYTSVITALLSSKTILGRAQGWDLFSHMRYVSHSEPDVPLYTLMIRACASPLSSSRSSEPEMALDLWTEMTVDRRLQPTVGAYDAIILACARSGSKVYVNEAFRLAKQMLDSHRDAYGNSAFTPDRRTSCALLEGAKRIGDLSRARWILAEVVNGYRHDEGEAVNEEIMMHVFHTYATYRPPFKRITAPIINKDLVDPSQASTQPQVVLDSESCVSTQQSPSTVAPGAHPASFTHIPPQSRSEVIHEVKSLFDRILRDTGRDTEQGSDYDALFTEKKFEDVSLTSRLLNSYISVYYKHSSLEISRGLFRTLYDKYGIPRTARTYVEALERCGIAKRGHERIIALDFTDEIWAQWQKLEDIGEEAGRLLNGRMIERAHIAYIRVLTLTGNIGRAVQHVRAFADRYPPSALRVSNPKHPLRSTRTVLIGERPLVRMTSVNLPDDNVPPLLMFNDLEVLHHRLVAEEAKEDIGYLTYLCKAYEWALRARRDETIKAVPPKVDSSSITA